MDRKDLIFVGVIGAALAMTLVLARPHSSRPGVRDPSPALRAASAQYPLTRP